MQLRLFNLPRGMLIGFCLAMGVCIFCLSAITQFSQSLPAAENTATSLTPAVEKHELTEQEKLDAEEGQALFRGLCSGCHGGQGRGGKGPDLTDDRWLHGGTDADIERTIKNGVPQTTMKKFGESLKDPQIKKIIGHIRSLAKLPGDSNWKPYIVGDSEAGKKLFYDPAGKALCFNCHTVNKQGGRIGPPLDRIATRRNGEFIVESILQPSKFIDPMYETVRVVTQEGQQIIGLRVNENNFSIQIREEKGQFHSFQKSELEEFKVMDRSIMPDNFPQQLTVQQLHDLLAFLLTLQ